MTSVGSWLGPLERGEYVATTRDFPARFPTTCLRCSRKVTPGQTMRKVMGYPGGGWKSGAHMVTGYMHSDCARSLGMAAFTPKRASR